MKLGQIVSAASIYVVAESREVVLGRVTLDHPRCGRVVIELQSAPNPHDGRLWRVTQIERPDK